ncbi:MAG: 16S rRNA (cytidine(1402)-2'-O)-methyltransferase [Spirochaetota bacterium]
MSPGNLYVIATPIGNLEDITLRALRILREEIDIVLCEDTRQTMKLLRHYDISLPTYAIHAHTTAARIERAVQEMNAGKNAAYMTDSGTPGVSDPGAVLVAAARKENIPIIPLPGPSALSTLISISGFRGKEIIFAGFLSKKEGKRKKELLKYSELDGIIVIYESPHRIDKLLIAIRDIYPDAELVVGRELTKMYEEIITGRAADILVNIGSITKKGEFAIAINNRKDN